MTTGASPSFGHELGRLLTRLHPGPLFGLTGSGNLRVASAFRSEGGTFVSTNHENSAVAMADGWSQVSGRVGIATVHQGPGVTNALTALVDAAKGRSPVLVIAGQAASPNDHQYVDQLALLRASGVQAWQVETPDPEVLVRALEHARDSRDCVFLNVPVPLMNGPSGEVPETQQVPPPPAGQTLELEVATTLAGRLARALRPTIIGGRGAVLAGADPAVRVLADRTGAALVTTAGGQGLFAGHPAHRGMMGGLGTQSALDAVQGADLLLVLGSSMDDWSTCHGALLSPDTEIWLVDVEPAHPAVATHVVVADARTAAEQVAAMLPQDARVAWLLAPSVEIAPVAPGRPGQGEVIDPAAVCRTMDDTLPATRTIVIDSGHFMAFVTRFVRSHRPGGFLFGQAFQSVGLGLARGIGAALADPDTATVVFCGDGGLMMSVGELETLARTQAPLLVVCLNDSAFGAEVHDFAPEGLDVSVARFGQRDAAAAAAGLGVASVVVTDEESLGRTVGTWLTSGRDSPQLIDCRIDPDVSATSVLTALGAQEWSGHVVIEH